MTTESNIKRPTWLSFRLTEDEKAAIRKQAKKEGKKMSEYIRDTLLGTVPSQ